MAGRPSWAGAIACLYIPHGQFLERVGGGQGQIGEVDRTILAHALNSSGARGRRLGFDGIRHR